MSDAHKTSLADDYARLFRILDDAPPEGLSIDDIQRVTTATGETWSYRTINTLLCGLGTRITHEKSRIRNVNATRYKLRRAS